MVDVQGNQLKDKDDEFLYTTQRNTYWHPYDVNRLLEKTEIKQVLEANVSEDILSIT